MAIKDKILSYIKGLDVNQRIQLWNRYCEQTNMFDDKIYSIEAEFDDIMYGTKPFDLARMIHFGSFNPMDEYFWFDGYGNLESGNEYELDIYYEDMADYIVRSDDDLEDDSIRELLDRKEEE